MRAVCVDREVNWEGVIAKWSRSQCRELLIEADVNLRGVMESQSREAKRKEETQLEGGRIGLEVNERVRRSSRTR
jgi:hypothetical protein